MGVARLMLFVAACLLVACDSSEFCGESDEDCWAEHLEVTVDGERVALETIQDSDLPPGAQRTEPTSPGSTGWAVGSSGTILKLSEHTAPESIMSGTSVTLEAVWGSSATDLWAVGGTTRLRFDGTSWTAAPPSPVALHAVWGTGPNDVFFVGDQGTVLHWNGVGTAILDQPTIGALRAVSGTSSTDVWVGGDNGRLFRFNGATFTAVSGITANIRGIWASDATRVFLATDQGIVVWDAGTLTTLLSTQPFLAVHGKGGNAHAAGATSLYRIDSSSIAATAVNVGPGLRSVWTSGSATWAVGPERAIYAATGNGAGIGSSPGSPLLLLGVCGVPVPTAPSAVTNTSALVPPWIANRPDQLRIDTTTSEFAEFELKWNDPNGCMPAFCFNTCRNVAGGARCDGVKVCTQLRRDFRIGGAALLGVRFSAKPTIMNPPAGNLQVTPVVCPGCNGLAATLKAGQLPSVGGTVDIPYLVIGDPEAPVDPGGSGGGTGGSCPGGFMASDRGCIGSQLQSNPCAEQCAGVLNRCITRAEFTSNNLEFPGNCQPEGGGLPGTSTACLDQNGKLARPCCPNLVCRTAQASCSTAKSGCQKP